MILCQSLNWSPISHKMTPSIAFLQKTMKTSFEFLTCGIIVVYNTHAADMVAKILHSYRERGLNLESNDDLCMGKCHVLSDVLLQFGELKQSVNQISQTVNQQSQMVNQQSQIINQLSQTVDQLSQAVNQQNRRKGRTMKGCDEKVCILQDNKSKIKEGKSALCSQSKVFLSI